MSRTDIQKYSDAAMYRANPTAEEAETQVAGPKVTLLFMTPDPLGSMAMAARMYEGKPVGHISEITDEERDRYFAAMQKTRLQAPFEFIDVHLLFEGVSRAFTHQLVRQRTAVYVQESQRFAVKDNARWEVAVPPSLQGAKDDNPLNVTWQKAVSDLAETYNALVNAGMPAEDARGLLPTNITTRIHYKTNLRNLAEHAGNRLCTQAQAEWRDVWIGIVKAIRAADTGLQSAADGYTSVYRARDLANLFRPICYATGKCEFMADGMDRACNIRPRVNAYHAAGVPSKEWDRGRVDLGIPAIRGEEWLADASAARLLPGQAFDLHGRRVAADSL